jgi:mannitol/fructose-specific phosphotransferase system IIA component (Ntr-type)
VEISRHLKTDLIKLELETRVEPDPETGELTPRRLLEAKQRLIREMVDVMEASGRVGNPTKLINDLCNREKKASTAIGHGVAVPHVRTYQAKELIIAIGRSHDGIDFDAPDGAPVHLFFTMAAPPYDDALYLKVFRALAENLQFDYFRDRLMEVDEPYDIIRAFKDME